MRLFGREAKNLRLVESSRGKYWVYPVEAFVEDLRQIGLFVEITASSENQFFFTVDGEQCCFTYSPEHKQLSVHQRVARKVCDALNLLLQDFPVIVYRRKSLPGVLHFEWLAGMRSLDKSALLASIKRDVFDLLSYKLDPYAPSQKEEEE